MLDALFILVPLSFAIIHFLEFSAIMARSAGIRVKSHMTGYAIQQAVYVGTRLFIVALLPMLGLIIDHKVNRVSYQIMSMCALAGAATFSFIALISKNYIISYYTQVIKTYKISGNFVKAFFSKSISSSNDKPSIFREASDAWHNPEGRRIMYQSAAVFAVYGTGVFISFYAALSHFDYRASISQLSGIINSLGTVLLTFFVEPAISRGIDAEREDAECLVTALLLGRLFGVAIIAQILLLIAFTVI